MKKLIFIFILILALLFVCLEILGSGGEYAAEKLFYRTAKSASEITMEPDLAPPPQLAAIENGMKTLIKKYPATASARKAHITLMEFYINVKKYDDAMGMADIISRDYAKDADILSASQFLRGIAYDKQGKPEKAAAEFKALKDKYPYTQLGIQMPIYIGRYYYSRRLYNEAAEAYRDAAVLYTRMENEHPGTMFGYGVSILLIQTYLNLSDYKSAGKALSFTLTKYASPIAFSQLLSLVERIYVKELNTPGKAVEIYKFILDRTKDKRMVNFLNRRIQNLSPKK